MRSVGPHLHPVALDFLVSLSGGSFACRDLEVAELAQLFDDRVLEPGAVGGEALDLQVAVAGDWLGPGDAIAPPGPFCP